MADEHSSDKGQARDSGQGSAGGGAQRRRGEWLDALIQRLDEERPSESDTLEFLSAGADADEAQDATILGSGEYSAISDPPAPPSVNLEEGSDLDLEILEEAGSPAATVPAASAEAEDVDLELEEPGQRPLRDAAVAEAEPLSALPLDLELDSSAGQRQPAQTAAAVEHPQIEIELEASGLEERAAEDLAPGGDELSAEDGIPLLEEATEVSFDESSAPPPVPVAVGLGGEPTLDEGVEVEVDTPEEVEVDTPEEVEVDTPEEVEVDTPEEVEVEAVEEEGAQAAPAVAPELMAVEEHTAWDRSPADEVPTDLYEEGSAEAQQAERDEAQPSSLQLACELARQDEPERIEAELLRELQATHDDPPREALLHYELGHLLESRLGNESKGAKAYGQALNLDPSLHPNVWAISRIFAAKELWPNLLKLYEAQAKFEQEPNRLAEVLLEKGWLQQDKLNDPRGAKTSFWAAYQADEHWLAPLLALERLAVLQGDAEDLAQVYRHLAETAEDPARRLAALVDLARLQEHLPDGTPQVALRVLSRAYDEEGHSPAVLVLMEQVARRSGLHEELATVMRRQADALIAQGPSRYPHAAARLRQAALLCRDQLTDPARAAEHLEAALALEPGDPLLQRDLLALAESQGDWPRAMELLAEQLRNATSDGQKAAIAFRLGLAGLQAKSATAGEAVDTALALLPGYLPAFVEKERQLLVAADLQGLVDLYELEAAAVEQRSAGLPLAEAADPGWAATALCRAAILLRRQLRQPGRAIELCQRALRLEPGCSAALEELQELYRETGAYEELARLLEQQAVVATGIGQRQLLEELAALYAGVLNDGERELSCLNRLHATQPDDYGIARRLAAVLDRLQRHSELAGLLQRLEDLERDSELQVSWRLERARLCEGPLGQVDAALELYQSILSASPGQPYAFAAVNALLRRLGRHEELAQLLRQMANATFDVPHKAALLEELAAVYRRDLRQPNRALEIYGELLELQPGDPVLLRHFVRTAFDCGTPAKLAEALERQVEQEEDPDAQARQLMRLAELQQDCLDQPERAEELWRKASALGPAKAVVIDAVEALLRREFARGHFQEAAETLETLRQTEPAELQAIAREEEAWLRAGPLGNHERAGELWDEIGREQPQNIRARWGKLRLAARQRNTAGLAESLRGLADAVENPRFAAVLELRAGLLFSAMGDETGRSTEILGRAVVRDPERLETHLALLARPDLDPEARADSFARVSARASDRVREDMRLQLAESYEQAGRLGDALVEIKGILERDPLHLPALIVLQRLTQAGGDREQEARVWARMSQVLASPQARAEAYARAAELLEEVGQGAQAAVLLRHSLAMKPEDSAAFDRLHRLYKALNDGQGLEALLSHRIRHSDPADTSARIALHFERAELRLQRLGDLRGAAEDLAQILKHEPKHLEALRQLARLYDEDNNPQRALALYSRYVEAADSRSLKRPAVVRMAELMHQLGRTADAVETCRTFLATAPDDDRVLGLLIDFYVALRDISHAIESLERLSDLRPEREWKARHLRRVGRLYWKGIKDLQEARNTLLRARNVDPLNIEVVDDLRQLSKQMGLDEDNHRLLRRAKDELYEALQANPLSVELYQKLLKLAEWDEDTYTLLAAMGVICFFNAAEAQDQELYQRRMAKMTFEPKRQLRSQIWRENLLAPGARSAHSQLWGIISEAVAQMYEGRLVTDPAALNVSRGDRVDRRAGGPVSQVIEPIAAAFGLSEFDIYLAKSSPDIVAGVTGERLALVVGHGVVTSMNNIQRFRIGRTLALVRDRALALEVLERAELERLFSAAVFLVEPSVNLTLPRDEIEAVARRLNKALSRSAKKALPLAVTRFLQEPADMDSWVDGMIATANRAGLLVCGDIIAAMGELVPRLGSSLEERSGLSAKQIVDLVAQQEQTAQLLVFSVSGDYLTLRKELQV